MPYKKKYYKKKTYNKTKADKALMIAKRAIKRSPTPELGDLFYSVVQVGMSPSMIGALLNGTVRGSDINNRDKRVIKLHSISIRCLIQHDARDPSNYADVNRIMLLLDRQPSGAAYNNVDVLNTITPIATCITVLNLSNRKRFKVLKDVHVTTSPTGDNQSRLVKFNLKLNNIETVYNSGNAGTIADISSGAIYLCYCTTSQAVSYYPLLTINSRIRYYDN